MLGVPLHRRDFGARGHAYEALIRKWQKSLSPLGVCVRRMLRRPSNAQICAREKAESKETRCLIRRRDTCVHFKQSLRLFHRLCLSPSLPFSLLLPLLRPPTPCNPLPFPPSCPRIHTPSLQPLQRAPLTHRVMNVIPAPVGVTLHGLARAVSKLPCRRSVQPVANEVEVVVHVRHCGPLPPGTVSAAFRARSEIEIRIAMAWQVREVFVKKLTESCIGALPVKGIRISLSSPHSALACAFARFCVFCARKMCPRARARVSSTGRSTSRPQSS